MQTYKHICFKKFALTIAYFSLSNFVTVYYIFLSRPYLNISLNMTVLEHLRGYNTIIPKIKQNYRYKSFLFSVFFVKNYFHNLCYAKIFCLKYKKYIPIYLSAVLNHICINYKCKQECLFYKKKALSIKRKPSINIF